MRWSYGAVEVEAPDEDAAAQRVRAVTGLQRVRRDALLPVFPPRPARPSYDREDDAGSGAAREQAL